MRKYRIITVGEKFNQLTLIKKLKVKLVGNTPTYYGIYKCDCGMEKMILLHNVARGITKSCGCLYKISNKGKRTLKDMDKKIPE
jgi:hypothetical protein